MKKLLARRRALMYLGLVLVAGVVACKAAWNFELEGDCTLLKGDVRFGYDGRDIEAKELPDDVGVDLEFTDDDGNVISPGAQGVREGNKVDVPAGATTVIITGPSKKQDGCFGCSAMLDLGDDVDRVAMADFDLGLLNAAAAPQRAADAAIPTYREVWIHVETLIPDYDGNSALKNVAFHADMRVPSESSATDIYELVKPILINGPGTPVPTSPTGINIEIETFTRVVPNGLVSFSATTPTVKSGGMRVFSMDVTDAFTLYDLDINGVHLADSSILTTGRHYTAPHGWRIVEVNVPDSVLVYDSTSASLLFDLWTQTPEDPIVVETHTNAVTWE